MKTFRVLGVALLVAGGSGCATTSYYEEYKRAHPDWVTPLTVKDISLEETLAVLDAPSRDGNRIVVQKLLILRTDVEPWQEIDLDAVRSGELPVDGSYAVAARRYCRSQHDLEVFTEQTTDWALLPKNSLAAYNYREFGFRCTMAYLFLPSTAELVATERKLVARIDTTFPRSPRNRYELYSEGLAYVGAGRLDDAARMLKAGDEALDSGVVQGTSMRAEGSNLKYLGTASDLNALRSQLVRELKRARGAAAQSSAP